MTALDDATIVRLRSGSFERTPQRLDPLGVQSAWMLVPLLCVVAVGYAVYSTVQHAHQLRDPALAYSAIVLLVLAGIAFSVRAHPALAPFGRGANLSVMAVTLIAALAFTAASWGRNLRIQDDWGQIAVALFLIAMPLYRPISEVMGVAIVSAFALGLSSALQGPSLALVTSPVVYFTVSATPIVALALGGCGYAWTMTGETLAWRQVAKRGQAELDTELRETARRMVGQEQMSTLNESTVPFLADLLRRGEITQADTAEARELAVRLRDGTVTAVDRTWLAERLSHALAQRGLDQRTTRTLRMVDDPERLDRVLSDEQRAIVGAIIATVAALPGLDPASVRIVASNPEHPAFELTAAAGQIPRDQRRAIAALLSSLRSVSMDASMRSRGQNITIRFADPEGENR